MIDQFGQESSLIQWLTGAMPYQGGGTLLDFTWKMLLINIDSKAKQQPVRCFPVVPAFRQQPCSFFSMDEQIIRPFNRQTPDLPLFQHLFQGYHDRK